MHWNYRVIKCEHEGEVFYGVHRVYYDDSGKPCACTETAVNVLDETQEGLTWTLNMMRMALDKPVLEMKTFEDMQGKADGGPADV